MGGGRKRPRTDYVYDYEKYRRAQLKYHFGMTLEQYNALLTLQAGVCAVCQKPEHRTNRGKVKALAVDHCHLTDEVRGLLCSDCNRAVGYLHDEPARAERVAVYLRRGFRFRII